MNSAWYGSYEGRKLIFLQYRHGASCVTVQYRDSASCVTVLYPHIVTTKKITIKFQILDTDRPR